MFFRVIELANLLQYVGIATSPALYFCFAALYTGNDQHLAPVKIALLFVIPVIGHHRHPAGFLTATKEKPGVKASSKGAGSELVLAVAANNMGRQLSSNLFCCFTRK